MINFLNDEKKWKEIRTSDDYANLRSMLMDYYNRICKDKEIPLIPFRLFMNFINTGDRLTFENVYFVRREQLSIYAVMCMLYPENEEYLTCLEDLICAICEEYTWCIPAHLPADRLNTEDHIDLFAAETGLYLAEIKQMLITRLNPLVTERITVALDRRIVQSFRKKRFIFEFFKSNWSSVCAGSVGMILMYENPDVYMEVKPRIEECMENYLGSAGDDGSISEGCSYWWYGFGFYILYHDLLKRYSFGRLNYFGKEKVKKIAAFYPGVIMSKNVAYSYADSSQSTKCDPFIMSYLNECFGIGVPYQGLESLCVRKFSYFVRDFLFYSPQKEVAPETKETYFDEMGAYILRKDKYAFAVKAGHNKEDHNHNDVGSFVVVSNDKQLFCDLGSTVYTTYTMSDESFKTVAEKASFGHNVPIVNGELQGYGREFCGSMQVDGEVVTIDFKDAYINKPEKLVREFRLLDEKIIMTDTFGENDEYTERFVSDIMPETGDGYIKIDCMTATFDKDKFSASFVEYKTKYHSGEDRTIYLIDVKGNGDNVFEMEISFDENARRNGEEK